MKNLKIAMLVFCFILLFVVAGSNTQVTKIIYDLFKTETYFYSHVVPVDNYSVFHESFYWDSMYCENLIADTLIILQLNVSHSSQFDIYDQMFFIELGDIYDTIGSLAATDSIVVMIKFHTDSCNIDSTRYFVFVDWNIPFSLEDTSFVEVIANDYYENIFTDLEETRILDYFDSSVDSFTQINEINWIDTSYLYRVTNSVNTDSNYLAFIIYSDSFIFYSEISGDKEGRLVTDTFIVNYTAYKKVLSVIKFPVPFKTFFSWLKVGLLCSTNSLTHDLYQILPQNYNFQLNYSVIMDTLIDEVGERTTTEGYLRLIFKIYHPVVLEPKLRSKVFRINESCIQIHIVEDNPYKIHYVDTMLVNLKNNYVISDSF